MLIRGSTHHAEGQKCAHIKSLLILDTPEHVDSENIKLKIGFRSFSKRDFHFIKCG
jgi:hypothetical protein